LQAGFGHGLENTVRFLVHFYTLMDDYTGHLTECLQKEQFLYGSVRKKTITWTNVDQFSKFSCCHVP